MPQSELFANIAFMFIFGDGFRARALSNWILQINKHRGNKKIIENAFINLVAGSGHERLISKLEAQLERNEFDPVYAEDFSIPVKPYIGLKLQPAAINSDYRIANTTDTQVCVLEASDGGPAQIAGLASNDLIISVNSEPILSIDQFLNIISNCNPNLDIQIAIRRNNERLLFNLNPFVQDAYEEKK
jgi:predicted metalloprotease with PDZ domain